MIPTYTGVINFTYPVVRTASRCVTVNTCMRTGLTAIKKKKDFFHFAERHFKLRSINYLIKN